jgi:polyisoprenoid-binding protein YceI
MFTNVSGKFEEIYVNLENEDDHFETSDITFSAEVNSVNTGNLDRDNHLRSADFFDAEHYSKITFKSTAIKKINEGEFQILGDLTIKNVTQSIALDAEYSGLMKDPWEIQKRDFLLMVKLTEKILD